MASAATWQLRWCLLSRSWCGCWCLFLNRCRSLLNGGWSWCLLDWCWCLFLNRCWGWSWSFLHWCLLLSRSWCFFLDGNLSGLLFHGGFLSG